MKRPRRPKSPFAESELTDLLVFMAAFVSAELRAILADISLIPLLAAPELFQLAHRLDERVTGKVQEPAVIGSDRRLYQLLQPVGQPTLFAAFTQSQA